MSLGFGTLLADIAERERGIGRGDASDLKALGTEPSSGRAGPVGSREEGALNGVRSVLSSPQADCSPAESQMSIIATLHGRRAKREEGRDATRLDWVPLVWRPPAGQQRRAGVDTGAGEVDVVSWGGRRWHPGGGKDPGGGQNSTSIHN